MSPILFWTFVAIMLFFAGMVVLNRNPVASALSLWYRFWRWPHFTYLWMRILSGLYRSWYMPER